MRWKTLLLLEEQTIEHRYAQVNATLMLRAWTRHLGFLTGMILAFVGAIFILSKLSESETRLSAEGGGAKGALATSSPVVLRGGCTVVRGGRLDGPVRAAAIPGGTG